MTFDLICVESHKELCSVGAYHLKGLVERARIERQKQYMAVSEMDRTNNSDILECT